MKLWLWLSLLFFLFQNGEGLGEVERSEYGVDTSVVKKLRTVVTPMISNTSMVHNLTQDDVYLSKWLKSNSMDVMLTANKLLEHVQWRKREGIDEIEKSSDWSYFKCDYPIISGHQDKRGQPIAEMWLSDWNVRKVIVAGLRNQLSQWVRRMIELQQRQLYEARKQNKNLTHATLLMDFGDFNFVSIGCRGCVQMFSYWGLDWETHYPGLYDNIIMINSSPAIKMITIAMRTMLKKRTMDTLKMFSDHRIWMPRLDSIIDRNERSIRFGGTLTREDLEI